MVMEFYCSESVRLFGTTGRAVQICHSLRLVREERLKVRERRTRHSTSLSIPAVGGRWAPSGIFTVQDRGRGSIVVWKKWYNWRRSVCYSPSPLLLERAHVPRFDTFGPSVFWKRPYHTQHDMYPTCVDINNNVLLLIHSQSIWFGCCHNRPPQPNSFFCILP